MLSLRWFAICLLSLPLTLFAADKSVTKDELDHVKEVMQLKIDAAQNGLQKDNQALKEQQANQDKRIDDIKGSIDIASLFLAGVGILITILVGSATFLGYFTVKRKAREEAQIEARKEAPLAAQTTVEKWLTEHHQELESTLADFRGKAKALLDEIAQHASSTKKNMTQIEDSVQEAADQKMAAMEIGASSAESPAVVATDKPSALQQVAQSLEQQPESEYGFKQWNTRAFAAYENRDLEGAARYWKQAAESSNAKPRQVAQTLFNSGVALRQQNRFEEAIATYDQVIARFGDASELALREQVARAMLSKGAVLSQLQRNEEAIAIYDQVIARFGDGTELALREPVAGAMLNKGAILSQLQRSEEAIAIYDQVIARFGDATELALREPVSDAQNSKGFALLCLAKQYWSVEILRQQRLQEAQSLFAYALEHNSDKGLVLGNQAYCAHLLGQAGSVVRESLHQALTEGGETLYNATLDDLGIHPVPPDDAFREILEEEWTKVKGAK
jgi:tetratricopeptide (TPR) repeat protein